MKDIPTFIGFLLAMVFWVGVALVVSSIPDCVFGPYR